MEMKKPQRIVLFGEGGTALSAADCLRNHRITVMSAADEPRLASYSRFVQNRICLQNRSAAQMYGCLESLQSNSGEELLLFPCADFWIEALAGDIQRTLRVGRMLPMTPGHLALTLDKAAFEREIARLDLPRPTTFCTRVDSNWEPPSYPFVLKPSSTYRLEAQCGVKALIVQDSKEWRAFDDAVLSQNPFLAQEFIGGASISVCFCTTTQGHLARAYATEKVHYSPMRSGSRVVTVNRPDAIELASRFIDETGFVGFGELEMIESAHGLVLLELNARPWSQVLMSKALGIPILEMAVGLMSGEEIPKCSADNTSPLQWIRWDSDLLFRRAMRRAGRPIRPSISSRRIYAQSFLRDPLPAVVYALTESRLGPGRFAH
jgi:predicted ATP-grasp superfamily ATP-dependent carboligase